MLLLIFGITLIQRTFLQQQEQLIFCIGDQDLDCSGKSVRMQSQPFGMEVLYSDSYVFQVQQEYAQFQQSLAYLPPAVIQEGSLLGMQTHSKSLLNTDQ